jgi:uncharacterized protein (DUF736 family)
MSDFILKENRGSLFKNDRKEKETHPDYAGKVNVAGVEYYINAWVQTSQKGTKYFSLSFNPIEVENNQVPKSTSDDLPF